MQRSVRSRLMEYFLLMRGTKKTYSDPKRFQEFMDGKRIENAAPYVIPENIQSKYNLEHFQVNQLMNVYVYRNKNAKNNPHILYLHGGAYVNNPLKVHWSFLNKIHEATGATITVPVYPKAPNYTYDTTFDLILKVYQDIISHCEPKQLIIMGDSAGGGMGLAFAQWLREIKLPQPEQLILLSPWLDMTMTNPEVDQLLNKDPMLAIFGPQEMGKAWAGGKDVSYYKLSPINGELHHLGKISIFVGTHELLLADARLLLKKAKEQEVAINYFEYPWMNHVFPVFPIPEAKDAIKKIVGLIHENGQTSNKEGLFANIEV